MSSKRQNVPDTQDGCIDAIGADYSRPREGEADCHIDNVRGNVRGEGYDL